MKRATRARALVFGALVIGAALVAACVTVIGPDDVQYGVSADGGGLDQTTSDQVVPADAGPDNFVAQCDAGDAAFNLQGCACAQGDLRNCYLGDPSAGDASSCSKAGTQSCPVSGKWSECVGASGPTADADVCFDGVDNDCDGVVDKGCKCSATFDLCKGLDGGAVLNPAAYNVIFDPPTPHVNETFDIYVISKTAPQLPNFDFFVNPSQGAGTGTGCQGAGAVNTFSCPAGSDAGCGGWWALRRQGKITTAAGSPYNVAIHDTGSTGCQNAAHANPMLTILP